MNLVDTLYWISGAFKGSLNWSPTANRTIALPNDSGTVLLDDRPIGSIGAGVSVRGYLPIVTVSSSKTLALSDANTSQICTAASTITIPANATVAFPIGTEVLILRNTTGTINLALASGVVATDRDGITNTLTVVRNFTLLKKTSINTWIAVNPTPNNAVLPGDPTCNTQVQGTNNTTIANTTFVQNAVAIASLSVSPVGVSVVDFTIPAGVRRLTILFSRLVVPIGSLIRLGTSAGIVIDGYYSVNHFIGPSTGFEGSSTDGMRVPKCTDSALSFNMPFYRVSPNDWNVATQTIDGYTYAQFSASCVQLSGELTTVRYISASTISSGSIQLLWEF